MAVKTGDRVTVEYTGTLDDGTVFETTRHKNHSHPMQFVAGEGRIIEGFDKAVMGMEKGQEKDVTIPSAEAYGEYDPNLTQEIPKNQVPDIQKVVSGSVLVVELPDGQQMPVTVKEVTDKAVVLDMNHPLAGKTLHFTIRVVDVE